MIRVCLIISGVALLFLLVSLPFCTEGQPLAQQWSPPIILPKLNDGDIYSVDIIPDGLGNLHAVWDQDIDSIIGPDEIYYSMWNGLSWSDPFNVSNTATKSALPRIACDNANHLQLVWGENLGSPLPRPIVVTDIFYSHFDGDTWSTPFSLFHIETDSSLVQSFNLDVDSADQVHLVWGYTPAIRYRSGSGASWSAIDTLWNGLQPNIFVNSTLHLIYVAASGPGKANDVFYAVSDAGVWSDSVLVYAGVGLSFYPQIGSDDFGRIHVFWSEDFDQDLWPDDILYTSSYEGSTWADTFNVTANGGTSFPPSVVIDTNDNVHIAWAQALQSSSFPDDIYYRWWDGASWSDIVNVSQSDSATGALAMVTDAANCLHLIWVDLATGETRIYHSRCSVTGVETADQPPSSASIEVYEIRPNPSLSTAELIFFLQQSSNIEIAVHNTAGSLVTLLFEGSMPQGIHTLSWDGRDNVGKEVPSGIYFFRLTAGNSVVARKMVVLK